MHPWEPVPIYFLLDDFYFSIIVDLETQFLAISAAMNHLLRARPPLFFFFFWNWKTVAQAPDPEDLIKGYLPSDPSLKHSVIFIS